MGKYLDGIFSNIIKRHTKTTLSMRQVEDYVCPGLASCVPTICVLLSTLFQERVSNFAMDMLLLQKAGITEQNARVSILESRGLAKPEELIMDKAERKPSGQKEARETSPLG
jgi:hypothetical protein